tara:strand:- start:129 stop:803 length:675 start_codon:yes stop_codon:yes gene_type:complete
MFNNKDNISLLWETLTEDVVNLNKENFDIVRYKFLNHIEIVNQYPLSLTDKNKKFIDEFIGIYNSINVFHAESFDDLVKNRQNEFDNLINPQKPESINLSDDIVDKPNNDITKKLEEYQNKRKNEPWLSNYEETTKIDNIKNTNIVHNENTDNITKKFISKLKIENETIDTIPIKAIDINKKVSFVDEPTDSSMKKNDVLLELREIKRKVSKLINILETTEIVI